MKYVPRSYAPEVLRFMAETGRCNVWMDPGLGKTSLVLMLLDALKLAGSSKFPALVLAPYRVARSVWSGEVAKWDRFSHLRVSPMIGTADQRYRAFCKPADIYTMNYENLPWLIHGLEGSPWPFKIVIPDESTRLKGFRLSHGSIRAGALAKAASCTARWVNLSGTPAPNGLIDLWGQCYFIDKGKALGRSYSAFEQRWFKTNRYSHEVKPKEFAQAQIAERIKPFTYSLRASDVFDLPEELHNPIYVDLPRKAMAMYREFEREMCVKLENAPTLTAKQAADLSLKCLQIASGAVFRNEENTVWDEVHRAKLDALDELLDELSGNPLLLAYHFKHDLARIRERFPQARLIKTKADEDLWCEGRIQLGLVHPASAGHGLNLQYGGHHIAFFSHWWDLEQFLQVIERIGNVRQLQAGLNRRVTVHHLLARGTVDERVYYSRMEKASVQDTLRGMVQ